MKRIVNTAGCWAVAGLMIVMLSRDAYGYLDPGTTNYVIQLVIAGILGALFAIKVYWLKLKAFFARLFNKQSKDQAEEKAEDQ